MITISIILSSLSAIALVLAIIFEGELKKKTRKGKSILTFKGIFLISIIFLMSFGNGFLAIRNINDNNKQYSEDTIRYKVILNEARMKRISDSIQILRLEKITLNNGLKSDSIKSAVVNNAVKALEAQRRTVERERENVFTHMQYEIKFNLQKMLIHYRKEIVVKNAVSNQCMSTRLDNSYLKKYESISTNKFLINYLMEASEKIDDVNLYSDELCKPINEVGRKLEIDIFLKNTVYTQEYLYPLLTRLLKVSSYKEFEAMNFSRDIPIDTAVLNRYLLDDFEARPPIKARFKKAVK
jgi:hypothetical protein